MAANRFHDRALNGGVIAFEPVEAIDAFGEQRRLRHEAGFGAPLRLCCVNEEGVAQVDCAGVVRRQRLGASSGQSPRDR